MSETTYHTRRVWDPVVRILHWWLAITLLVQIALGAIFLAEDLLGISEAGEEGLKWVHATVGYLFGAGLLARILWLFFAPGSGSWRDLLPVRPEQRTGLAATAAFYLKGLRGNPPFYRAHNPLAGLVYAAFFVIAAVQVITGATIFTTSELGEGWEEVHEIGFWLIVAYIIAHWVMVAVHEITETRSLVSAMIHGRKLFTTEELEHHSEANQEEELK